METKTLEVYFKDLKEDKQKEVLELYDLDKEEDGNFELSPLFILEYSGNPDEEE